MKDHQVLLVDGPICVYDNSKMMDVNHILFLHNHIGYCNKIVCDHAQATLNLSVPEFLRIKDGS